MENNPMRKVICIALLTLVASNASALNTETTNLLATIAMPLAVAAVADIAGVPQDQLTTLLAMLNNANVPPAQFVEVVRYVPVALIDDGQPFVQYIQEQTSQGVTGSALVPLIEQRLRPYYPSTQINVTAPAPMVVTTEFIPPVVVRRVAEVRAHPHGGPPGQIKKQLGLQTGAEVVHGGKVRVKDKGRGRDRQVVVVQQPPVAAPQVVVVQQQPGKGHGNAGKEHGNGKGNGKGKDKGHGKDKGKD
jgi:hypothetical protein